MNELSCTEACVAPHDARPITACVICGRELQRAPTGYFYRIGPDGFLEPRPQLQETAPPPAD